MLNKEDEEYKNKLERARLLRNSIGMTTEEDLSNNATSIQYDNDFQDRLNRAKQLRNSVGMITDYDIEPENDYLNNTIIEDNLKTNNNITKNITENNTDLDKGKMLIDATTNIMKNPFPQISSIVAYNETKKAESNKKYEDFTDTEKAEIEEKKKQFESNTQNIVNKDNKINQSTSNSINTKLSLANPTEITNAQELSSDEIDATFKAEKLNKQIEQGGKNAFEAYMEIIGDNILDGFGKKPIAGLANVATTLTGLGVKGLESVSKLFGLNEAGDNLNAAYNSVIDFGSNIHKKANYASTVTSQIKDDFTRGSGQVTDVISNMIGNQVVGYAIGIPGTVAQGLTVGGSSSQEVLNENKDNIGQATITGIAKGYVSYFTEKMFDANLLTRGQSSSISRLVDNTISKKIKSNFGKEFANRFVGVVGENIEELVEDNIDNLIDKLVNNKDTPDFLSKEWWDNTSETAKVTTISTIIMSLLGLGGETFKEKESDINADYWINEAKQIIDQENMAIHYDSRQVKSQNSMEQFYVTQFNENGELENVVPTLGKEIENIQPQLMITPVVVKDTNTNLYEVIDGATGVVLDNSYYGSIVEAENSYNDKVKNLSNNRINNINNTINEANYIIKNNIMNAVTQLDEQLPDIAMQFIENNNSNATDLIQDKNIDNLNTKVTNYTSDNVKNITDQFKTQKEYTKNEMANIWNNDVDKNNLNVIYDENGKINSYIAIEEEGNSLKISQYDNNDNIMQSETIVPQNGIFTSESINNAIEKVTGVYEQNNDNKTPSKSTFYNEQPNYAVSNINEIETEINKKNSYTLDEIGNRWSDIIEDTYDLILNDDNYVNLDENNGHLEAVLYNEDDEVLNSIPIQQNKDGKYTAKAINDAIKQVATIQDENKPIQGQVDIEGNEVRSMKKNNSKQISNSLENYSEKRIKSITSNKNAIIVQDKSELIHLIKQSFEDTDSKKVLHIGILPKNIIERIKSEITQIKKDNINNILKDDIDYTISIKQDEIRHLTDKEGMTINKAIDFVLSLDKILTDFDSVSYHIYNKSQNGLRFKKKINNDIVIAFDVISNTKQTIRVQSIHFENDINKDTEKYRLKNKKRRSIQLTPDNIKLPSKTSETDNLSTSSIKNSIPQKNNSVKNDKNTVNSKSMQNSENNTQNDNVRYMKKNKKIVADNAIKKSIENFSNAETEINRQDVLNIANSLDIKLKNNATKTQDTKMAKKAGKNKIPNIVEITDIFKNLNNKNAKDFRNEAEKIAMDLYRDKTVVIIDTGSITEINKSGIDKTYSGKITESKLQTADNLEQIIEQGIYGYSTLNKDDKTGIIYHHFFTPVNYKGENGLIRVVIKEYSQNKTMNDKFYYHQLEYVEGNKIEGIDTALPRQGGSKDSVSTPSTTNSISQNDEKVKNNENTAINKSMQNNTKNTSNEDIRFAKRTAKETDNTKLNAERGESYIEQEIQKIEKTGNWDDSIPITKLTDIRKTIEDYLGLGVKKGHFRQQAYGIYKTNSDVIRTKEYKDIDTVLHETGHAIDLGNRLKVDKESIADELLTAIDKLGGYENETRTIRLEEGFAEVIREYSIVPEQAKTDYPQTIAILEGLKKTDKKFNDFITKVQQQAYNYIHQNPRNRNLSNMSIGEQTDKVPLTKEWIKQQAITKAFDKDYAVKVAVNEFAKKQGKTVSQIKASENIYYITRLFNGVVDKSISILADGYIDNKGIKLFPGLSQIGEILGDNPERWNDLRAYLVAQRDLEYKAKTLKTGLRTTDSKAVVEQFKNDTQIQQASKLIYDTLNGIMQYAVDNGLISQENVEKLKQSNAFYVPMQRVIENRGNQLGKRGTVTDIIKKRTGSELDVKDVLENIVGNSINIIQQVENNNALKALYKQGESTGLTGTVYDVIPAPMKRVGTQSLEIWEKELQKQGVNTNDLNLEKTIDLFAPNNKIDVQNKIISFINNDGKRIYLQFNDSFIFNAIANINTESQSIILNICNKLNTPLRYGATMANLGFAIPNMKSDTAQAAVYSTAGFIPVVDNALGVLDVLSAKHKPIRNFVDKIVPGYAERINYLYTLYQQSGASSGTRLSQERKSTQRIMKDIYGTKNSETLGIEEKYKPLKRLLDLMTYIPEISEQSTRFEVFKKNYDYYKNKGTAEMDTRILAALESRDATQDFSRMGTVSREVNKLIPFSAARIGGIYTFAEKMKANPKQTSMRIAILTAIAMGIKAMGYDDDEIDELNQRKKDDNFVMRVGDSIVTIKKPQGILRSIINLAEYIQDLATDHIEEGKEAERLAQWLNNAIMDNMPADEVTGLVPNAVTPLIENAINKDFYYNTDIVKSYDQDLPDADQYYEYNSQLAIWLGKIFNYSPAKIDNLISGYFGGLGTTVTNTMDYALGKAGVIPERPEMGAEQDAIGKRFIVNVNSNSSSIDEIYNRKTELTKLQNGGTISSEEEKELETIKSAISNLSDLNKQIKEIKKDLTMSGTEKAEKIKILQQEKTDTARQALGKSLIHQENETKIQSTQFYPDNTLKKNGYMLELNSEQKKEYEQYAYDFYSKYEKQGLYSEEKLNEIKTKAKDYAKNQMFKNYRSSLVKTK